MLPTYVVHAKSLKARKRHIERQMKAAGLSFDWITDYDPDEITPDIDAAVFAADCRMPLAAKSCALKHVEAFRRIVGGDAGMAMVLEDDAVFDKGFAARLADILSEAKALSGLFSIQVGAGAQDMPWGTRDTTIADPFGNRLTFWSDTAGAKTPAVNR